MTRAFCAPITDFNFYYRPFQAHYIACNNRTVVGSFFSFHVSFVTVLKVED